MLQNQKTANPNKQRACRKLYGVPGRIRTADLSLRRRTLYPAELRGQRYEVKRGLLFIERYSLYLY